jgi:ribosomal protein S27AE
MEPETKDPAYAAAWRDLWKRRICHWFSFFGLLAYVGVCSYLKILRTPLVQLVAISGVFVAFLSYTRVSEFACPRCQQKFFIAPAFYPAFLQNACGRCGLLKYARNAKMEKPI